jgi:methylmalonyl-CoA mutase N-terminal domain/subunit
VVGVNCYTEGEEELEIELHRIRPEVEQEARANLARLRAERDPQRAEAALQAIRTGCHDGSNLLERFVAAAHADCTLGEIAQVLREEFGEYVEPKIL